MEVRQPISQRFSLECIACRSFKKKKPFPTPLAATSLSPMTMNQSRAREPMTLRRCWSQRKPPPLFAVLTIKKMITLRSPPMTRSAMVRRIVPGTWSNETWRPRRSTPGAVGRKKKKKKTLNNLLLLGFVWCHYTNLVGTYPRIDDEAVQYGNHHIQHLVSGPRFCDLPSPLSTSVSGTCMKAGRIWLLGLAGSQS